MARTWSFAALLGALVMVGPFSIDLYLPAFAAIGGAFAVPQVAVQATLSTYLFAYAFMMLWHGALSDAFGRRIVVLTSLSVYAVATLGCAIAGNIESLWLARALQGLSAGAGLVVGRAIVRETDAKTNAPKRTHLIKRITQRKVVRTMKDMTETETTLTLELHDAQAAQVQLGKHHKLWTDRIEEKAEVEIKNINDITERLAGRIASLATRIGTPTIAGGDSTK